MMSRPLPSCLILPLSLNLSQQTGSSLPICYLPERSAQGQAIDPASPCAGTFPKSPWEGISRLNLQLEI